MESKVYLGTSADMSVLGDCSVDLVVTSPPYPMVPMWDLSFSLQDSRIGSFLSEGLFTDAFKLMHTILNSVWSECYRVLRDGGFLCVNIGDCVRSVGGIFRLFSNVSEVLAFCEGLGFTLLPGIIWRKRANIPAKFMGSGMLPCGAYVPLEHEYILVFRKGLSGRFTSTFGRDLRRRSSYFWEERNLWFSDLWEFPGVRQDIGVLGSRDRSGSYPIELPYRLIQMYSCYGDVVLDPFLGLGTTLTASLLSIRVCYGFELDSGLFEYLRTLYGSGDVLDYADRFVRWRYLRHLDFVRGSELSGKSFKYWNSFLGCRVKTRQEEFLRLYLLRSLGLSVISDGVLSLSVSYVPFC